MANTHLSRLIAVVGLGAVTLAVLAACSSDDTGSGDGRIVLTVGHQPPEDQPDQRAAFDSRVAAFEEAHPDIDVQPSALTYGAQDFQTQLAGGTLPIVMQAPFTEPPTLIANRQVADITDQAAELGLVDGLNPDLLKLVEDADGRLYGIPVEAYALGLAYNRDLFTQAGLDPDSPPQTWDEVRAYAKQISDRTDAAGYAQLSTRNCGGWLLTAMIYGFGGRLVDDDGTKAVFDDGSQAAEVMDLIHDMKWDDGSMTEQNLYDCESVQPDFAAGRIGMTLKADFIPATQQYGMNPEGFGYTGMPTGEGSARSTLAGGNVAVISPKASDEQKTAALEYIRFMYLDRFFTEEVAVEQATAAQADGAVYELPGIAPVSEEQYQTFLGWIQPYNAVPVANWQPYLDSIPGTELIPEPKYQGQQIYAELDSVIQAVLTDQNADTATLLKDAQTRVDALLARS